LLSLQDVADRLGVSKDTVRRMIDRGELEAVDIGVPGRRALRVKEPVLVAYVRKRTRARTRSA
jgi:excisionase family DNA binding protein